MVVSNTTISFLRLRRAQPCMQPPRGPRSVTSLVPSMSHNSSFSFCVPSTCGVPSMTPSTGQNLFPPLCWSFLGEDVTLVLIARPPRRGYCFRKTELWWLLGRLFLYLLAQRHMSVGGSLYVSFQAGNGDHCFVKALHISTKRAVCQDVSLYTYLAWSDDGGNS